MYEGQFSELSFLLHTYQYLNKLFEGSVSTFIGFASFDSFQCPPSSRLLGHICHAMFSGHGVFVEGHVIAKDQQLVGLLNVGPMI